MRAVTPGARSGGFAAARVGIALVIALVLWLLTKPGAWPVSLLVVGCAAAVFVAHEIAGGRPWLVPAAVVGVLATALLLDAPGTLSSQPLAGPLGYANAKAALYAQGVVAGLMLGITLRTRAGRWTGWVAALAFAIVPPASNSLAATLGVAGVVVLLMVPPRWARAAVAGCMMAFLLLLGATLAVAAGAENKVSSSLDERRVTLWRDAWSAMWDSPARGVGADGFVEASSAASKDRDARWVHNEYLELGAEHGLVALGLALAATLWLFWELMVAAGRNRSGRICLLGAAAVTVVAAQACVDYVAHFGAVPMVAALLAGTALGASQAAATGGARWVRPLRSSRV
jgi:O-antigen ligase